MGGYTTNKFQNRRNQKSNRSMIIGIRPLMEAIDSGKSIDNVFVQRGIKGDLFKELLDKIKANRIGFKVVPEEKLNRISRKNHQGIIAFASPVEFINLEELTFKLFEEGKSPRYVMLDRISDVGNFGAICRSAECFGYDAVIIPFKGSAQVSEDAVKTSAGAIMKINICKVNDLAYTADYLKNSGIQIIGITEKTEEQLTDIELDGPHCLVMGSEEDGISPELLNTCDKKGKIKMLGQVSSLNVSVSAGIAMHELSKFVHI